MNREFRVLPWDFFPPISEAAPHVEAIQSSAAQHFELILRLARQIKPRTRHEQLEPRLLLRDWPRNRVGLDEKCIGKSKRVFLQASRKTPQTRWVSRRKMRKPNATRFTTRLPTTPTELWMQPQSDAN